MGVHHAEGSGIRRLHAVHRQDRREYPVEVLSPKGKPYDHTESATILINGAPGSKHFLAFHSAGTKNIRVHSGAGGKLEKLVTTVEKRPGGNSSSHGPFLNILNPTCANS